MIKNENDLLCLLIENKNFDNSCNHIIALNKSHLDIDSYSLLCKNLISKGYINQDLEFVYITQLGLNNYISPKRQKINSFLSFLNHHLLEIVLGVIITVVSAIILFAIGI